MSSRSFGLLIGMLILAATASATAQQIRPSDEKRPIPDPLANEAEPSAPHLSVDLFDGLPNIDPEPERHGVPLPPPDFDGDSSASRGDSVFVKAIRISGNTLIPTAILRTVVTPSEGTWLSSDEIERIRDDLTRIYVDQGWIASSAIVRPQDFSQGVLEIEIVEGKLVAVEVKATGQIRTGYIASRLKSVVGQPVRISTLEKALSRVQRRPIVRSVTAKLVPDVNSPHSRLLVDVVEANPWGFTVQTGNDGEPSLGEWAGTAGISHLNLTGMGDSLTTQYRVSEGLHDLQGRYRIPVNRFDTQLEIVGRSTWSEIVLHPIDELDISNRTSSYGANLIQPIVDTDRLALEIFLRGEWRRGQSYLAGERVSFDLGPEDGKTTVAVLRMGFDALARARLVAGAVRAQWNQGIDALGATSHRGDVPDGQFSSGLFQIDVAARHPSWPLRGQLRAAAQLTSKSLLGLEQFGMGGIDSVHGYRQNQLVRDNGATLSGEMLVSLPFPRIGDTRPEFELGPNWGAGFAWDHDQDGREDGRVVSVGVTLLCRLGRAMNVEAYWARPLKQLSGSPGNASQDSGFQTRITWNY